ncbi:Grx_C2.1 - glutaredoxin subgroup I [Zea mays]|uniref:Grx_C2.1-glutaredoxin subgroup I n=1 Tax=Zea mays TaxID=4577 RepID=B6SN61_MAIZE|nr:Grx_C2.1 - glutaredoxin subgroup I [Zea mays]ACG26294.1 Grx_C2.1 - glutaredoxin subgroup I [Zea mays]AQK72651.1 Grx_C2.1-glutaredoxin subgroup I [Zea mays]|eukprot:NP_001158948.1 Grx_C2.1 - glutaredoxin subgroup I [Zea mays]
MALEKAKEIIASSPVDLALRKAKETVASHPVVVFSKTYCPFCTRVKQLLAKLGASYKAIELDVESDGAELQSALAEWTGQRTVPNVFVKGERIGGCDATMAMHDGGKLVPLLTEAGAIVTARATATTTTPSL